MSENGITRSRRNLTFVERTSVVIFLIKNMSNGRLKVGAIKEAAKYFDYGRHTIQRLWRLHIESKCEINMLGDIKSTNILTDHRKARGSLRRPCFLLLLRILF